MCCHLVICPLLHVTHFEARSCDHISYIRTQGEFVEITQEFSCNIALLIFPRNGAALENSVQISAAVGDSPARSGNTSYLTVSEHILENGFDANPISKRVLLPFEREHPDDASLHERCRFDMSSIFIIFFKLSSSF